MNVLLPSSAFQTSASARPDSSSLGMRRRRRQHDTFIIPAWQFAVHLHRAAGGGNCEHSRAPPALIPGVHSRRRCLLQTRVCLFTSNPLRGEASAIRHCGVMWGGGAGVHTVINKQHGETPPPPPLLMPISSRLPPLCLSLRSFREGGGGEGEGGGRLEPDSPANQSACKGSRYRRKPFKDISSRFKDQQGWRGVHMRLTLDKKI